MTTSSVSANTSETLEEFSIEDTETVIKSAVGSVLTDCQYTPTKINDWSNSVISEVLKGLQSLNRPYKYVATVIIMQKNGAGLVSAASTYWDTTKDGLCRITWENATMHTIVTVYGLCLNVDSDHNEETLPQSTDTRD